MPVQNLFSPLSSDQLPCLASGTYLYRAVEVPARLTRGVCVTDQQMLSGDRLPLDGCDWSPSDLDSRTSAFGTSPLNRGPPFNQSHTILYLLGHNVPRRKVMRSSVGECWIWPQQFFHSGVVNRPLHGVRVASASEIILPILNLRISSAYLLVLDGRHMVPWLDVTGQRRLALGSEATSLLS